MKNLPGSLIAFWLARIIFKNVRNREKTTIFLRFHGE
jgi:hypothetical protein